MSRVRFDAIVLHYTLFGEGQDRYPFSPLFERFLDESPNSYKVAFLQDEHHWCRKRFGFLENHGIDCVFTLLKPEHGELVYREHAKVDTVVSHIPGYVGPELVDASGRFSKPMPQRSIDIGYRGRPTPSYMGRGAYEKYEIGLRFGEAASKEGLKLDVSVAEQDRIYGDDWFRFLGDSRGTLGVESGASFLDLEDEVREEYERLARSGREPGIGELERGALGLWDGNIPYRTISPRQFEAAAFGVCQILFEGRYSGLLDPMKHYIPLRKDLSNVGDAIALFRDDIFRSELVENARRDLIDSGRNTYQRFIVEQFDPVLQDAGVGTERRAAEAGRAALARSTPALLVERSRSTLSYHPVLSKMLWKVSRPVLNAARLLRARRHRVGGRGESPGSGGRLPRG